MKKKISDIIDLISYVVLIIIGLTVIICLKNLKETVLIIPLLGAYIYAIKRVKAEEGRRQFALGKEDGRSETGREYRAKIAIKDMSLDEHEKLHQDYKKWQEVSINNVETIEEFYHLRNAWGTDRLLKENKGKEKISKMSANELNLFERAYEKYRSSGDRHEDKFHKERFILEPEYKKYLKKVKKQRTAKYLGSKEFRDELKNAPTIYTKE